MLLIIIFQYGHFDKMCPSERLGGTEIFLVRYIRNPVYPNTGLYKTSPQSGMCEFRYSIWIRYGSSWLYMNELLEMFCMFSCTISECSSTSLPEVDDDVYSANDLSELETEPMDELCKMAPGGSSNTGPMPFDKGSASSKDPTQQSHTYLPSSKYDFDLVLVVFLHCDGTFLFLLLVPETYSFCSWILTLKVKFRFR